MVRSKANVLNRALSIIGGPNESSIITDPDSDESDQAKWLRNFWEDDVDYCLRLFDWIESGDYADLTAYTGTDVEKADWGYIYDRPDGCHVIRYFCNEGNRKTRYPYEEVGQYILSNADTGYIRYSKIMDPDAVHLFSVELSNLIAARLATSVAPIWKPEMLAVAEAKYDKAFREASNSVGVQGYVEEAEQWADI